MAQVITRNLDGTATNFNMTQIINIRATTENQLIQVFKNLLPDAIYENKPLALVQTKLSDTKRQINILKAVMISSTYWDALIASASFATVRQINIYTLVSDFLLKDDRFNRLLPRLAPKQNRYNNSYEIFNVGGNGQVDLGYPFISSTLDIVGAVPTNTFPSTGLLEFNIADVGTIIDVAFVTSPIFNVVRIARTHDQPDNISGTIHPPYAYVMHPLLATPLGITLPVV